jgi:hypothetical protein
MYEMQGPAWPHSADLPIAQRARALPGRHSYQETPLEEPVARPYRRSRSFPWEVSVFRGECISTGRTTSRTRGFAGKSKIL